MARAAGTGSRLQPRCVLRRTSYGSTLSLSPFTDNLSDVEEDDDDRAFSEINALSSPASTPPQVGLPDSPDLSQKINGPSVSMAADVEPLRLLQSPGELEHVLSHRSSSSTDDVEADLVPTSPAPSSINASQNSNPNRKDSRSPHLLPRGPSMQTQSPFLASGVNRFRRGTLQIRSPAQASVRFGSGLRTPQSQDRPIASQTLRSPDSEQVGATSSQSQGNGSGMSWLNTQAFRPPAETQELYESD